MRFSSVSTALVILLLGWNGGMGNCQDQFNYHNGSSVPKRIFGVQDWDQVTCDDPGQCLGWPDGYESRRGWDLTMQCRWCPAQEDDGPKCTHHRQSPINLDRSLGIPRHEKESICKDGHWMAYLPGACKWSHIVDNESAMHRNGFTIDRHALEIKQPIDENGTLQCPRPKFPRIDFAFGFPEWWILYQTKVKTPSEHTQNGKRYHAEIQLDHVYQVPRKQREIGRVAIFLDGNSTVERWDFLDKLICQWREVEDQTRKACGLDSVSVFYDGCRNPGQPAGGAVVDVQTNVTNVVQGGVELKNVPQDNPEPYDQSDANLDDKGEAVSDVQRNATRGDESGVDLNGQKRDSAPGVHSETDLDGNKFQTEADTKKQSSQAESNAFSCDTHYSVNFERMCKDGGCCQTPRQDGNYCHRMYEKFGDDMQSACSQCCSPSKTVGLATKDHPVYPRIQCSNITLGTSRICKKGGCCDGATGAWCRNVRDYYQGQMDSICWYCCSEPRDIGPERRVLSSIETEEGDGNDDNGSSNGANGRENPLQLIQIDEANFVSDGSSISVAEKVHHPSGIDRRLGQNPSVNFDDVPYHPYEWMQKVRTEYYFRYAGTQTVPPCFGRVHWRVMKDPIQVHSDQIVELQRLLAHRIAPLGSKVNACERDTAGRPVDGTDDVVEVNRPLQAENPIHRAVFCECKDWDSKWLEDQAWCNISNAEERLIGHPYNFDTLPGTF